MYRYKSAILILFSWAFLVWGIVLSKPAFASLSTNEHTSFSAASDYSETSLNINTHSHYKKVQYSKKLSRYFWLKDKKPTVFADYNKLSKTIFAQYSPPPINSTNRIVSHLAINDYNQPINAALMNILSRLQNLPATANRLNGWKESNILYKGSITYDPFHISTII